MRNLVGRQVSFEIDIEVSSHGTRGDILGLRRAMTYSDETTRAHSLVFPATGHQTAPDISTKIRRVPYSAFQDAGARLQNIKADLGKAVGGCS